MSFLYEQPMVKSHQTQTGVDEITDVMSLTIVQIQSLSVILYGKGEGLNEMSSLMFSELRL